MIRQIENRDLSQVPTSELRVGISRIGKILHNAGCLPNGLGQLIVGSVQYRCQSLFFDSGANKGLFRGDPGLDELWEKWVREYDGFSGDNLAATALYQHERYDSKNEQFPKPETPEFTHLVQRMNGLGRYVKEFEKKEGWQAMNRALYEIPQEWKK